MSGAPLGSNPAASAELTAKYSKLFQTYRLAVNGAHFGPSATTLSGTPLWEWRDPAKTGIVACEGPPLLRALKPQQPGPQPLEQSEQREQQQQQQQQQQEQQEQQQQEQQ